MKLKRVIPAIPEQVWTNPWYFIAFGFGSGALPIAPGTFGTLFAIPFYLILSGLPLKFYLIFVCLFIVFASLLCSKLSREINVNDHQGMCIDEFAGYFVTMIHAPIGIFWVFLGFILFRLFDIWKPFPISYVDQHIHGGFGMVLDDVLAGLVSMLIIQLIAFIYI